jgi:hypothetical protein
MGRRPSSEGLQVVVNHDAPEKVRDQPKYPYYAEYSSQDKNVYEQPPPFMNYHNFDEKELATLRADQLGRKRRNRRIWISGIVIFIVIAAAVAGAVGGTSSKRDSNDGDNQAPPAKSVFMPSDTSSNH